MGRSWVSGRGMRLDVVGRLLHVTQLYVTMGRLLRKNISLGTTFGHEVELRTSG